MNKEMIYLDSSTIGVSDENGKITKRIYEDNIEDILAQENKVELINETINELEEKIEDNKNFGWFLNAFSKGQILVFILAIIVLIALKNPEIITIIGALLIPSLYTITLSIAKKINNKRFSGLSGKLECAKKIKKEFQKELEDILVKSNVLSEISQDKVLVNEIIPVAYSESLDDKYLKELDMAYEQSSYCESEKEKALCRTRNKK